MLGLADSLKQTQFYQEGIAEGREKGRVEGREKGRVEEAARLVLRQLNYRVGDLSSALQAQVNLLSLEQLEELGEALLDFADMADLLSWLQSNTAD